MSFQDNLIRLRKENSPSAKAFAQTLGISYTTYHNYEKGAWPSEENLIKIADALHVSIDELLGYKVDKLSYWFSLVRKAGLMIEQNPATGEIIVITPWGGAENFSLDTFIATLEGIESHIKKIYGDTQEKVLITAVRYALGRPFKENPDGTATTQRPSIEEIQHESARLAQQQKNATQDTTDTKKSPTANEPQDK